MKFSFHSENNIFTSDTDFPVLYLSRFLTFVQRDYSIFQYLIPAWLNSKKTQQNLDFCWLIQYQHIQNLFWINH